MAKLKQALAAAGYVIVVDAKIILIVRHATPPHGNVETSVYDNGKVLVKTPERQAAEAAYADLEPRIRASLRQA